MFNKKSILGLSVATIISLGFAGYAYAESANIGASVLFRQALSITNVIDMEFGAVEYVASAGSANITLSPDGSLVSDNVEYTVNPTGVAGSLDISGDTGSTVNISCDATGSVSDGVNTLDLDTVNISVDGGSTSFACTGSSSVAASPTLTGSDQLVMGATLVVPSASVLSNDEFNTANAGGSPINVTIVYQ